MKHVPLKVVEVTLPDGRTDTLDWKQQLQLIIRQPMNKQQGMDLDEIRKSLRVIEALENSNEKGCDLEDADYDYLVQKVSAARFGAATPQLLEFLEAVTNA